MSKRPESPWSVSGAANDNHDAGIKDRGIQTQGPAVICDLPLGPGIMEGEVDLVARFFVQIMHEVEAANDNEVPAEN